MADILPYIASMRLRTVPLSLSGVILGTLLSYVYFDIHPSWMTLLFLGLTTVSLQILSNLSNELGDVLHGTDTEDRQGPQYGLNSGRMTIKAMRIEIGIFVVLTLVFGLSMIYFALGSLFTLRSFILLLLGIAAIRGAMHYTLGDNPYGYRGLGDLFVFIFFGLVSVTGAAFVVTKGDAFIYENFAWELFLPAVTIGLWSIGVLNVNNIRDMKTDAANRVTVAIKLGERRAKIYQTILIVLGWLAFTAFFIITYRLAVLNGRLTSLSWYHFLWLLPLPLHILHLSGVWKRHDRELDPMLPLLVMSTFLFAILAGTSCLLLVR